MRARIENRRGDTDIPRSPDILRQRSVYCFYIAKGLSLSTSSGIGLDCLSGLLVLL